MKKSFYALIVAFMILISFVAHSFLFETGDTITGIKDLFNKYFNNDEIIETKVFHELRFDYSYFEIYINETEYYNYQHLNSLQQGMYKKLLDAAIKMKTGNIQLGAGTKKDAIIAMYAMKYDHPDLFWLGFEYGIGEDDDNVYLRFDKGDFSGYTLTHDEREMMMSELKSEVEKILDECITADMTDFEKEVAIHDWICSNVIYDETAKDSEMIADNKRENPLPWTSYGAIVNRVAVCEGYSKAFQLLLYCVGINSNLVCGNVTDGSPHMWNTVMLDNDWYYVDVLWDDVEEANVIHTFLNVDSDMISKTHTIFPDCSAVTDNEKIYSGEYNLKSPTTNSIKMNYYVIKGTVINSDDEFHNVVVENIIKAADEGYDSVEFFYSYKEINENIVRFDIKNSRIFSAIKGQIADFKGFKYIAYSYGSFILKISR